MFAIWWAWRSLHVTERLLFAAALVVIAFCAGTNWQIYHSQLPSQPLLQESSQSKLILWDSQASLIVDVSGAVRNPGIVRLPRDSRVQDAIKKSGGLLPGAIASAIDLAATVNDGQQVRVTTISQESTFDKRASTAKNSEQLQININQASTAELESLPGIGPVMAARIVAFRKTHGAFTSLDDLNAVKGIGVKKIEKLQPYIVFH